MSPAATRLLGAAARLPAASLGDLIEGLIAVLDARAGDPDLEPEIDCCDAGDDAGTIPLGRWAWGDEVHAARRRAQQMLRAHARPRAA